MRGEADAIALQAAPSRRGAAPHSAAPAGAMARHDLRRGRAGALRGARRAAHGRRRRTTSPPRSRSAAARRATRASPSARPRRWSTSSALLAREALTGQPAPQSGAAHGRSVAAVDRGERRRRSRRARQGRSTTRRAFASADAPAARRPRTGRGRGDRVRARRGRRRGPADSQDQNQAEQGARGESAEDGGRQCARRRGSRDRRRRTRAPTGEAGREHGRGRARTARPALAPAERLDAAGTASPPTRPSPTAFDEIVDADELCDAEELTRLRAPSRPAARRISQGVIGRLANRLQRRLLAQQTRTWDFDLEEGMLDAARLRASSSTRSIRSPTSASATPSSATRSSRC